MDADRLAQVPPRPAVVRIGLGLLLLTDVALLAALVGPARPTLLHAAPVFAVFCVLYAAGLTWGWARVRPLPRHERLLPWILLPQVLQALVYLAFWSAAAWQALGGGGGPLARWMELGMFEALLAAFFGLGPVGAILLPIAGQRTVALAVSQLVGPVTFLLLFIAGS